MAEPKCAACRHPEIEAFEGAISRGELSVRKATQQLGVHRTQLRRHIAGHPGVRRSGIADPGWRVDTA